MERQQIIDRIKALKKEKNAVILAHYYSAPEIQDIADFLGDSLGLSQLAATTSADIIVFGGVHFMAETAAIISPDKKVFSPAPDAGCSLADSVTAAALARWKQQHPDGIIVSYVNTTAAVKAVTDYCCTSANALKVVLSLPEGKPVLFGPDRNLGSYIIKSTGRQMELWKGACVVHEEITSDIVSAALDAYPDTEILIHPEAKCSGNISLIDNERVFFYSTAGMLAHVASSEKKKFVIATEVDTIHSLKKQNPEKTFIPLLPSAYCREMKKVTLENILDSLEHGTGEVIIDKETREKAIIPIQRMLQIQ